VNDECVRVDGAQVERRSTAVLRELVLGRQGTYVTLAFRRNTEMGPYVFEVELMRGAAEFIDMVPSPANPESGGPRLHHAK
jgi:hypothetical protein